MTQTTVQREWFSPQEAERFSGLSRTTLWRIANSPGELKVARVGRTVRISRRSLEDYMERAAGEHGGEDDASEEFAHEERGRA